MVKKTIEILVGLFMILGMLGFIVMAFKVSGFTGYIPQAEYDTIIAEFDGIGGLKVRAPVMIAGVKVGHVDKITLNANNYRAKVILKINKNIAYIPIDTSANIYTQGLLGSNYVNLSPGYAATFLKEGDMIEVTHGAVVLEKLIGQFLYTQNTKKSE